MYLAKEVKKVSSRIKLVEQRRPSEIKVGMSLLYLLLPTLKRERGERTTVYKC